MSRLIPLMCVAVAVGASSAHAQKSRVVVVPFTPGEGASETATRKFEALVIEELKSRTDVLELVAAPKTSAAPAPAAADKPSAKRGPNPEAIAALESGKKAFDELRFEDAVSNLRKGIDGMLADPATADYESITDAYVKLAASAFRMGEEKSAKTALLDFARFAPTYELSSGFPPVFQREFEKAKKRLEKQPKGTVSIEGPAGSTAYINGRDLGMVPIQDEVVPGGTHYVKVEGPKGEKFGQTINVTGPVKVKASFGGAERAPVVAQKAQIENPAVAANLDTATQQRLVNYVKAVNADYALVAYVYKTSDSQLTAGAALFQGKRGLLSGLTPVSFDTDVLTANTEAFKLGDELTTRLTAFGTPSMLPLNLAARPAKAGTSVARNDSPTNTNSDELDTAGPRGKKVVLTPKVEPKPEPVAVVEEPPADLGEKPPAEVKKSSAGFVVLGIGLGLAAGTAAAFGIMAATSVGPFRPVSGTVTATW